MSLEKLKAKMEERKGGVVERALGKHNYIIDIPVDKITPNPYQPRRFFEEKSLEELASSIKQHGLTQAITVVKDGDRYIIEAGERRWRATVLAQLPTIRAEVKQMSDDQLRINALIENIQRENLKHIEVSLQLRNIKENMLAKEPKFTDKDLAALVGKSYQQVRSYVALLKLCPELLERLKAGEGANMSIQVLERLSSVEDQQESISLFNTIVNKEMSRVEALTYIARKMDLPKKDIAHNSGKQMNQYPWGRVKSTTKKHIIEIDHKKVNDETFQKIITLLEEQGNL